MAKFSLSKQGKTRIGNSRSLETLKAAIAEQVALIEAGQTTALEAMRLMFTEFPVLKKERRQSKAQPNVLTPLMDLYVAEMLNLKSR